MTTRPPLKIIYIDDDTINRALIRDMLESEGFPMAEASSARAGLDLIAGGEFDLVFMDLRMPNMNGITAIRQIRAKGSANGRTPFIVVVTGDLTDGVVQLCRDAGADDFLQKPVSMERLFAIVGRIRRSLGFSARAGGVAQ